MQDKHKEINMETNNNQTVKRQTQTLKAAREKQRINSNTRDPQ